MEDSQQCTATAKSTGERCKNAAIPGGNVCRFHGGEAQQVKKKASERLDEMADSVTKEMQDRLSDVFERMDDPTLTNEEFVKLAREARQLSTDIWDRTGNGPNDDGDTVDVNVEVDTLNADEKAQLNELFEREVQE